MWSNENTSVSVDSFIFGADALVEADVSLKFGTMPPKFIAGKPVKYESPVYWYSPLQQEFCVGYYILEPLEVRTIRFLLCKAAPVVRTDVILITAHLWQEVQILPSRSDLEFDYKEDCYTALGCIANLTNSRIKGLIWGKFEVIKDKQVIPLNEDNFWRIIVPIKSYCKTVKGIESQSIVISKESLYLANAYYILLLSYFYLEKSLIRY